MFATRNQLTVDLGAIRRNIARLSHHLGDGVEIMGMVKADGYGVGAYPIAQTCLEAGLPIVAVADVREANELRAKGFEGRIYVIHTTSDEVEEAVTGGYTLGVSQIELVDRIAKCALRNRCRVSVHLVVNTGMNRLGCPPEEAPKIAQRIAAASSLAFDGVMSHLSSSEDPSADSWTLEQATRFDEVIALLERARLTPRYRHLANSAGSIRFSFPGYNLARVGLALYSLSPSPATAARLPLEPALTLTSPIVEIRECAKGEPISYNCRYRVERESQRIGVLPVGYADGLHRRYAERGAVTVCGKRCPIAGTICMDFTMIDLSSVPEARIGERAILFGPGGTSPEQFAAESGGSVYELITCLGRRIYRNFLDSPTQ